MKNRIRGFLYSTIQCSDGRNEGFEWVQFLRVGKFRHPDAPNGVLDVSKDFLRTLYANYETNVRRLDIDGPHEGEVATDYSHRDDEEASGWIQEVRIDNDGEELWIKVDWTKTALQKIMEKEYRFISPDIHLEYVDNESGQMYGPTILGAGLTNRPHIKGMRAIFEEKNINANKGAEKMEEELKRQIAELKAEIATLKGKLGSKAEMADKVEKEKKVLADENSAMKTQLSEANDKIEKADKENAEKIKELKFAELLKDGKILPAQKESFMKMDVKLSEEFFKDAKVLNMSEKGHGSEAGEGEGEGKGKGTDEGEGEGKDVEDEINEKTVALMEKDKSLRFGEAMDKVFAANPKLKKSYDEKNK